MSSLEKIIKRLKSELEKDVFTLETNVARVRERFQARESHIRELENQRNLTEPTICNVSSFHNCVKFEFKHNVFIFAYNRPAPRSYYRGLIDYKDELLADRLAKHVFNFKDDWLREWDITKMKAAPTWLEIEVRIDIGDSDDMSTARSRIIKIVEDFLTAEMPKYGFSFPKFKNGTPVDA